ncbi:hypothetical protein BKA81DRAFT_225838 [Phyllosticta paracitricarpa]
MSLFQRHGPCVLITRQRDDWTDGQNRKGKAKKKKRAGEKQLPATSVRQATADARRNRALRNKRRKNETETPKPSPSRPNVGVKERTELTNDKGANRTHDYSFGARNWKKRSKEEVLEGHGARFFLFVLVARAERGGRERADPWYLDKKGEEESIEVVVSVVVLNRERRRRCGLGEVGQKVSVVVRCCGGG